MPDAKPKPAPRGRPVKNTMPEPIPDTPENIARGTEQPQNSCGRLEILG